MGAAVALALLLSLFGSSLLPSGGGSSDPGSGGGGGLGGVGGNGSRQGPSSPPSPARPELGWGFTHTQFSAETGQQGARERAGDALSALRLPQNQHIMGWGAENPEPSPGRYDFSDLDDRIELIRRTGGTPVITLCCAPDWMKGGEPGETDWSKLETAPRPEYYRDFADLAGEVAARYPDVRHFIVWNELKGFYDDEEQRWDYEGYTRLYNLVYRELKRVDERNLVGGPYVVMDSQSSSDSAVASELSGPWGTVDQRALDAVSYWNENKAGADFVVIDGFSYGRDRGPVPDAFAATEKFTAVGRWVREETGLPLWWAEWYVEPAEENGDRDRWSQRRRTAVHAAGLIAMARGGASTGFYWNPQRRGRSCPGCLWSSTELEEGGTPLPMLDLLSGFAGAFPPGTDFRDVVRVTGRDRNEVMVLADDRTAFVVNTLDRPVSVTIDGRDVGLGSYQVRWVPD